MANPSRDNELSSSSSHGQKLHDSHDFASLPSQSRRSNDPITASEDNHHSLQDRGARTGFASLKDCFSRTISKLWHHLSKPAHAEAGSSKTLPGPNRQSTNLTVDSISFQQTEPWDQKAILSLDGGGIRGYSALLMVQDLMKKIKQYEKDQPEGNIEFGEGPASSSYHPENPAEVMSTDSKSPNNVSEVPSTDTESSQFLPCHYFDYMAGTSTGGLISIMLGRLRMNVDDCIKEYETLGQEVFGHSRLFHLRSIPPFWFPREKYNHKTLERVIQDLIQRRVPKISGFPGGKTFAFDENRCRVVVVAYQQDPESILEKPYLFRTYKNLKTATDLPLRNPGPAHDIPILEVARATSAAPAYFKEMMIDGLKYVDGGFGATNNPCLEIFREVRKLNNYSDTCLGYVVSIGTGRNKGSRMKSDNSFKQTLSMGLHKFIHYENFARKWASESEEPHENMLDQHRSLKQTFGYSRLNVEEGLARMKLDEWKCRGPVKIALGRSIGWARFKLSQRKARKLPDNDHNEKGLALDDNKPCQPVHLDSSHSEDDAAGCPHRDNLDRFIPSCFEPRIKTLETIRTQTEEYLKDPERQAELVKIAKYLVENRRARVRADRNRWRKTCFATWYQCQVQGCQRGQHEYQDKEAMYNHLRHKHAVLFVDDADHSKLKKMVKDSRFTVN